LQAAISFAKIIVISIQPSIAVVGRLPGTDTYGDVEQYPMAVNIPGVLVVSIKFAWLCFANASPIREKYVSISSFFCFFQKVYKTPHMH
jgi:low affinity sulfate transporter 2